MIRLLVGGKWLDFDYEPLALTVLKSPTNVDAMEIYNDGRWMKVDISDYIAHKKGVRKVREIVNLPKYKIGEVIDLSYINGGLPNRILVHAVFMREQDTGWCYQVTMENTGGRTTLEENFITTRASRKRSKVYSNPDIIRRMADGFRFCGNFPDDEARSKAKLIAECDRVVDVRLYPSLYPNNSLCKGKKGIWIRYKCPISDDGMQYTIFNGDSAEIIKGYGGAGSLL